MTDTANAPERISDDDLRKLLDEATPGPWAYRLEPYDDWGLVRSGSGLITQARDPRTSYDDLSVHRCAGTDPWEPNARLIALAPDLAKERLEHAAHFAELVAAAYMDAAQVLEDEIDLARIALPQAVPVLRADIKAIKNRTPTKAMSALTAYGERMKAEGAREAQAKIARLTMIANELSWSKKTRDISNRLFAALQENANG